MFHTSHEISQLIVSQVQTIVQIVIRWETTDGLTVRVEKI